eukprot:TRINITY_DN1018_c0_g1_i2.p1 TRINITY_DN1018_c0_g1~~TRINITY_DN1018_c0_g1_i2.p1  ORF type:complete len:351 (+),score=127.31 TRINITY_DN1018_c0_g1_i2:36-1055(+)
MMLRNVNFARQSPVLSSRSTFTMRQMKFKSNSIRLNSNTTVTPPEIPTPPNPSTPPTSDPNQPKPLKDLKSMSFFEVLKEIFEPWQAGSKNLFKNAKQIRQLQKELGKDNFVNKLDRSQFQMYENTWKDVRKVAPVLVLFFTPIIGYFVPLLCLMYPKLLPDSFLNPHQLRQRRLFSSVERNRVVKELVYDFKKLLNGTMLPPVGLENASFMDKLNEKEKTKMENTFKDSVDTLSSDDVKKFARYLGFWTEWQPEYFIRQKLADHLEYISNDDMKLRRSDLSQLSEASLKEALMERGHVVFDEKSRADMEESLKKWIEFTRYRMPHSLLLYSMAYRKNY